MNQKHFSIAARWRSFSYAFNGIKLLVKEQHNTWIHIFAAICVTIGGFLLNINALEWIICGICFGLVFAAEAFNSAIEMLADRVCSQQDPMIGKSKDLAAAAVLLTAMGAAIAGLIIFIPKIWNLL